MSIIDVIVAKIAPHDCLACGTEGSLLCKSCLDALPAVQPKRLNSSHLELVYSATLYSGAAKDLIWRLKSSGAQEAARIMASAMVKLLPNRGNFLIVPVPTATGRARQRGYDQAKLLARELAKQAKQPLFNCLARHGQAHQVGSSREQRLHQLAGSLRVKNEKLIKNQYIMLVDDVVTTGASLETAAKLLIQSGAAKVEAITFAQPQLRIKPERPPAF